MLYTYPFLINCVTETGEMETELTAAREELDILKSKYADHHSEAATVGCSPAPCSEFDREEWLESPECLKCYRTMSLDEGCEWSDDDDALLCPSCMTWEFELNLERLRELSQLAATGKIKTNQLTEQ